jgi:molecular chaperone DnaK (HSP70)
MQRIGIDLGTTNAVAAQGDRACPVDEDGRAMLPSVVAFLPNGGVQVGRLARRRRAIDGANTLFSSKRIIGRRFDSYEVRIFRERYPLVLEEQDGGWPAFRTRAGLVTPVEVATHVLGALTERTGIDPGVGVTVTVPSSFAGAQREATGCSRSRSPPPMPTSAAARAASARSSTTSAVARSTARSWTAALAPPRCSRTRAT